MTTEGSTRPESSSGPGLRAAGADLQIDPVSSWISALGRMSPSHPDMARILHVVERLQDQPYRSHALFFGEPGTGKEGLARLLHRLMHPEGGAQVSLHLVGCPPEEIEERLRKAWEQARGGSLIIDEILALPATVQRQLHANLSEQRLADPGAVAVLAQTDGDPMRAVSAGALRHDLLYKLGRIVLAVPPLRERPADMAHAALWTANRVLKSRGLPKVAELLDETRPAVPVSEPEIRSVLQVTAAALDALSRHPRGWPGNFRELEAVMERAILLYSDGEVLRDADIVRSINDTPAPLPELTAKPNS
jgi:DNA-binding NtrC family response regulator